MKKDIRVIKKIGVIASGTNGMQKELNVVSIDNGPVQYDFREWSLDHSDYAGGISFDSEEAKALFAVLKEIIKDDGPEPIPLSGPDPNVPSDDDLFRLLQEKGIEYVDKRKNDGALWIVGGHELDKVMIECGELGHIFYFSQKGGRVTKNQPGWYLPAKKKKNR